ncbi:unnamed protein product [Cyprideis torosa]|uniref:Uncharacterized protein n=1 Tax=Cyprideis torosa TaxID=163714 RepID=A0A7R8WR00_9CRUS|nr:unnamed protein product [Cyprideis torosa]CAG0902294.1 unnamed protein product [Cyprideis torosa]
MKKEERGSMSMAEVSTEQGEKVFLVRWMDNSVVTTASTTFGSHPVNKVQRWSQAKKDRIRISCPQSIQQYNASMGGTDRQDQNANTYRVQIRRKKWWFPLFTFLLDVSVQNAWLLGRAAGSKDTNNLLEFRRAVASYWLQHFGHAPKTSGRRSMHLPAADDLRYDDIGHLIRRVDQRRRCNLEGCTARTQYECIKCNIHIAQ